MPTISFYLQNRKSGKAKCPIRVWFNEPGVGNFYFPYPERIEPEYWDTKKQRSNSKNPYGADFNKRLASFCNRILNAWDEKKQSLTIEQFRPIARTLGIQKKTRWPSAFQDYVRQIRQTHNLKTIQKYEQLIRLLNDFSEIHPFDLDGMNMRFYDAFRYYLYALPNDQFKGYQLVNHGSFYSIEKGQGDPVPLLDDSIGKHVSNLKTMLAWVSDRESVCQDFKKWSVPTREYDPISLTLEELERLERAILPDHLDRARTLAVMECRTGQRISDIQAFNKVDFDVDTSTWTFTPIKGNRLNPKKISVPFFGFIAPALSILQRCNFTLPKLSQQKLNKHIKEAARIAGIDSPVTYYRWSAGRKIKFSGPKYEFVSTHTGRKTFITLGLQYMNPKAVKDLAGISDWQTLKHYEGQSETETIKRQLIDMGNKVKSA